MTYQCRRESCGREKYKITDNEPEHLKKLHISHDLFATGLKLKVATMHIYYAAYSTRSFSLVCMMQIISTCYSVHQVSRHWQNQCSQTVSTHQTQESSDLPGDILSMMQTLLLATSVSTIPVIECQRNKVKTYTHTYTTWQIHVNLMAHKQLRGSAKSVSS